ncbi:MAG TPA: F0F1 ATP synthase subunit epsilon [Patescibacteria group bacterium]|nr:F0F1 ATP synthase subunit epsilon [Patescibacteria group bacterium]
MIHFKIVTPEREVLDAEADSVTLPTQMGEITILPNHIPLVANLAPGEMRFRRGTAEESFAVSGGFVEVKKNHEVVVLADTAERGHEIDLDRAERARERASKFINESYKDQKSLADASASLQKHLARIRVARKHRTKSGSAIHTNY